MHNLYLELCCLFAGVLLCCSVTAQGQNTQGSVSTSIAFGADGSVASFVGEAGSENLIDRANPGRGFFLQTDGRLGEQVIRLDRVEQSGKTLVVSRSGNSLPRFTFDVARGAHYLAIKLRRVEGLPTNATTLHLEMRCQSSVHPLSLDCMIATECRGAELSQLDDKCIRADWNYLWHRNPADLLGGVAIYPGGNPEKEDDSLLEIWANEDVPKPAINEPWTVARASQWIDDYVKRFSDQTMTVIAAATPDELYAMTDYAEHAGMKQIYLHTDTWRGEYWPVKNSHIHVNTQVFPRGEADLKKYIDHLRQRGMFLALHYCSGGIGPADPKRIAGHVDRNLASWGAGTLEESVDKQARTLRFRPAPGCELPLAASSIEGQRANANPFFVTSFVRVGEEIVSVGSFEDTDKPVWTLKDCARGCGATTATAHAQGAEAQGLYSGYGQNFIPDVDSPLFEEMAKEYADFANTVGLDRLEYDALEIHSYPPWGTQKFTDLVARRLDHPVVTGCSGGFPVWSNIEARFNRVRKSALRGTWVTAAFTLERGYRRATDLAEFNYSIARDVVGGGGELRFQKSEAMFGITTDMLNGHGLSGQFGDSLRIWKGLLPVLTTEQRQDLGRILQPPSAKRSLIQTFGAGGYDSVIIREAKDAYELVPMRVMVRREGDAPWMAGVESPAVGPRQFVRPGEVIQLENPYQAQPASFTIRVLSELADGGTGNEAVVGNQEHTVLDEYLTGVPGNQGSSAPKHPLDGASWVWFGDKDPASTAASKTVYLRRIIEVPAHGKLVAASLFYSADNQMDAYVNGRKAASSDTWQIVLHTDITALLHPGKNLVALAARNSGGPGGVVATIRLQMDDGRKITVPTDSSWMATDKKTEGWELPASSDTKWGSALAFASYGAGPWGKGALLVAKGGALQPKASEVQNQRFAHYAQDGDGVVLTAENPRTEDLWIEKDLPFWSRTLHMPGHGLSMEVTGDGSGAVLVLQIEGSGARDYVVKIDFTGKRTIAIPTGEVSWANGCWGRRPGTERFGYNMITGVAMGFGYISAQSSPRVKVERLHLLEDRPSSLVNPIITTGTGTLAVRGVIETGQYLCYTDGNTVTVMDENRKKLKDLPITQRDFKTPSGFAPVSVSVSKGAPLPWLEVQFTTQGPPVRVPLH